MLKKIYSFLAVLTAFLMVSAANADKKYDGPKMDLSKFQPEFRIGFLGDEASQDIIARNGCLKDYIEKAYNVPAKMFTFKDYAGTMESMLGGNLDYGWFGASGYAGIYLQNPDAVTPVLTRMQPTSASLINPKSTLICESCQREKILFLSQVAIKDNQAFRSNLFTPTIDTYTNYLNILDYGQVHYH